VPLGNYKVIHYVYVDAENHFLRTTNAAREAIDYERAPEIFASQMLHQYYSGSQVPQVKVTTAGNQWTYAPELMLFWQFQLVHGRLGYSHGKAADFRRTIFVAPCSGDDDAAHAMRMGLRNYGFDPLVIDEKRNLQKQRELKRTTAPELVLDKAKGCDIALAIRMVTDASSGLFDACHLFTSDADFLPAVEAVRSMGKHVTVYGVRSVLPDRSPYLYVPDDFCDLGEYFRKIASENPIDVEAAKASFTT
jgi:hypothetical protein